jgi:hypothetical protein
MAGFLKTVQERFYQDPEWGQVEDLIIEFMTPLLDMSTIDTSQPAENVKAEVIGRRLAYDALSKFVQGSKIVNKPLPEHKNTFR